MKKSLLSILLCSTMIFTLGCGTTNNEVNSENPFGVDGNTEKVSNNIEDTKVTATSLLSKFIEDLKQGLKGDLVVNELVALDVNSVKNKIYNTTLNITSKATCSIDTENNASIDGYLTHYYMYNTNYADVYNFLTNNKAKDSKALINKSAKEFTQNVSLYNKNGDSVIYNIDNNVYKTNSRNYGKPFVISDFSNLNFKETTNGYEVTGTVNNKFVGNLFNFEDIYMGSETNTQNCKYSFDFTFDKDKTIKNMKLELAEGVGTYNISIDRLKDMYMKEYKVTLSNIEFGVEGLQTDMVENVKETKFLEMVNKF